MFYVFTDRKALLFRGLGSMVSVFVPLVVFFAAGAIVSLLLSRGVGFACSRCTDLAVAALTHGSPLTLTVTVASFPDRRLVTVTLMVKPLVRLPILCVISGFYL